MEGFARVFYTLKEPCLVPFFEVILGPVYVVEFWLPSVFGPVFNAGDDGFVVTGTSKQTVGRMVEV